MTKPSLTLPPDTVAFQPPYLSDLKARAGAAGWRRKMFALALHATCLALFWILLVSPVVSPIAKGELAREFKPVLELWQAWVQSSRIDGRTR